MYMYVYQPMSVIIDYISKFGIVNKSIYLSIYLSIYILEGSRMFFKVVGLFLCTGFTRLGLPFNVMWLCTLHRMFYKVVGLFLCTGFTSLGLPFNVLWLCTLHNHAFRRPGD